MPLYNKAPYVRKAVESVVGQTYSDWELIVVDDGSTDGGGNIVASIADPRIRLVRQENAGVSAARNRGVAISGTNADTRNKECATPPTTPSLDIENAAPSSGEVALAPPPHLCFLDADDWWEPAFLEEMAGLIERHPDAGIYGTGYYIVKNGKKRVAPIGVEDGFAEGEINYCQVYAKTLCMPLWTGAVCMPRHIFDEQGGFPTGIKLGEDFLLWVHIALAHPVVLLNKPLSNYNQDVDITFRGTHHLHAPKEHMLWHLEELTPFEYTNDDYKQLVDGLRTYSLHLYLLDSRYRSAAQKELAKVDWNRQPNKTRRLYRMPIVYLQLRMFLLLFASRLKHIILK